MKFRFGPGAAIIAFFVTLIAVNVAFYIIAFNNPPIPAPASAYPVAVSQQPAAPATATPQVAAPAR